MNIKKIGLSALAGSLAMVSASAVELAVSGQSEVTYLSKDNASTGNPFGFGNEISFTGTGDVNGMTATYFSTIADGGASFASSQISLDMGDMGLIGFDQGVGSYGVSTIDDKMPYAYEEIWTYTGGSNGLRASGGTTNVIGYINTLAGYTLNLEINPGSGPTSNETTAALATAGALAGSADGVSTGAGTTNTGYNWALTGSPIDGLNVGVGYGKEESTLMTAANNGTDTEFSTAYVTYAIGGATIGYQKSEGSGGKAGNSTNEVEMYGISFSVNENLAISYNVSDNTFDKSGAAAVDVTEETSGVGASYTMGSAAVRIISAKTDNVGGTAGTNEEATEISLVLAF
jgi:outer membrane protein OmpU